MPAGICGRFFRILTSSPYPISPPPSLRSTRVVSNEGGTEPQILSCFSCGLVMKGAYGHRQSRVTGFEATRCAHVSHELKSSSISFLGTSNPSAGMALWNSARETCPSPLASHERKRSSTRVRVLPKRCGDLLRVRGCPLAALRRRSGRRKAADLLPPSAAAAAAVAAGGAVAVVPGGCARVPAAAGGACALLSSRGVRRKRRPPPAHHRAAARSPHSHRSWGCLGAAGNRPRGEPGAAQ